MTTFYISGLDDYFYDGRSNCSDKNDRYSSSSSSYLLLPYVAVLSFETKYIGISSLSPSSKFYNGSDWFPKGRGLNKKGSEIFVPYSIQLFCLFLLLLW